MKTITLTQPWATLVAIGAKRIETRSWSTNYRGPLAIHAAKTFGIWRRDGIVSLLKQYGNYRAALYPMGITIDNIEALPRSCIVATCSLIACYPITASPMLHDLTRGEHVAIPPAQPEYDFGDYTPGRFAWVLCDVEKLSEPIPARGALGLWDWNDK